MEFEFAKLEAERKWNLWNFNSENFNLQGSLWKQDVRQCARPINPQTSRLFKRPDTVLSNHY